MISRLTTYILMTSTCMRTCIEVLKKKIQWNMVFGTFLLHLAQQYLLKIIGHGKMMYRMEDPPRDLLFYVLVWFTQFSSLHVISLFSFNTSTTHLNWPEISNEHISRFKQRQSEFWEIWSYRISKALYEKHIPLVLTKIPKNGVTFKSLVTTFVTWNLKKKTFSKLYKDSFYLMVNKIVFKKFIDMLLIIIDYQVFSN